MKSHEKLEELMTNQSKSQKNREKIGKLMRIREKSREITKKSIKIGRNHGKSWKITKNTKKFTTTKSKKTFLRKNRRKVHSPYKCPMQMLVAQSHRSVELLVLLPLFFYFFSIFLVTTYVSNTVDP